MPPAAEKGGPQQWTHTNRGPTGLSVISTSCQGNKRWRWRETNSQPLQEGLKVLKGPTGANLVHVVAHNASWQTSQSRTEDDTLKEWQTVQHMPGWPPLLWRSHKRKNRNTPNWWNKQTSPTQHCTSVPQKQVKMWATFPTRIGARCCFRNLKSKCLILN